MLHSVRDISEKPVDIDTNYPGMEAPLCTKKPNTKHIMLDISPKGDFCKHGVPWTINLFTLTNILASLILLVGNYSIWVPGFWLVIPK